MLHLKTYLDAHIPRATFFSFLFLGNVTYAILMEGGVVVFSFLGNVTYAMLMEG